MTQFSVYRYVYDEGRILPNTRTRATDPCFDKAHAEWVADEMSIQAGEADEPYVFRCEEEGR
jgi:hypothetical protein